MVVWSVKSGSMKCFLNFFHHRKQLEERKNVVHGTLLIAEACVDGKITRKRRVRCVPTIESCKIPWEKVNEEDS